MTDQYLIGINGVFYQLDITPDGDEATYLDYLVTQYGKRAQLTPLSRKQVTARLDGPLPEAFPEADVVTGEGGEDAVRGWWPATVDQWLRTDHSAKPTEPATPPAATAKKPLVRRWSDVPNDSDKLVTILTSYAAMTPSGMELTHGPLTNPEDLARFVWWRWPHQPSSSPGAGKGPTPQIWITGPALRAAGMKPPRGEVKRSDDLTTGLAELFGCRISAATAGFFTATFPDPQGGIEGRKVKLILLPFLWLEHSRQRPKDMGIAGERDTMTQLPDDDVDELAAAAELGRRIAWIAGIATAPSEDGSRKVRDGIVLPEPRPAAVGASILDRVRKRSRTRHHIDAGPIPDDVAAETQHLDPNLVDWSNMPKTAKGNSVDVEVDQRAAYLASAGKVELGYGTPVEVSGLDPAAFTPEGSPPFALCRVSAPAAMNLDGLTTKLPLPHGYLDWAEPRTFWATTRAVQQLMAPVSKGGAGIGAAELKIDKAWVWPGHSRLLRGWADRIRVELAEAIEQGDATRIAMCKNIYKAFLGRMTSSEWGPGQRHYQQPAWVATIHADTRWRAMAYATGIAAERSLYPIRAMDIDTFVYRVPEGVDPTILTEPSQDNGKYRIKYRSDQPDEQD